MRLSCRFPNDLNLIFNSVIRDIDVLDIEIDDEVRGFFLNRNFISIPLLGLPSFVKKELDVAKQK